MPASTRFEDRLLPLLVVLTGLALRVYEYLRNNSLWGDEAMLALSIASRPFKQLLQPLAYGQVAPLPFLWSERLVILAAGVNEWALRLLPLTAGLLLCIAMMPVGRRMLRREEALAALVLVAFSQTLVRYSAEVKSYSLDALLAVSVVGATAILTMRMDDRRSWVVLAMVGAVATTCSIASAFVCAGALTALLLRSRSLGRTDYLSPIVLLGLTWGTLLAFTYLFFYRHSGNAPYMRQFWEGSFLAPGAPHLSARIRAALLETAYVVDPGSALLGLGALTLFLGGLGAFVLHRRGQTAHSLLLTIPVVAPFLASTLRLYPVASRLMLFAAPLLAMLVGVGMVSAATWLHRRVSRLQPRWVIALLLLPAVVSAIASLFYRRDQQLWPLVQELERQWRNEEGVYVFHRVVPAWLFYSTDWAAPNLKQLTWAMAVSGPGGVGHENGPPRGRRISGEGSDLVYDMGGHPVLLGTSSGVQGRPVFGYLPGEPDPGWARNEAQRIRRMASPRAWILLGNANHQGLDLGSVLLAAAREEGARITFQYALEDGRLYRLEFSGPRSGSGAQ